MALYNTAHPEPPASLFCDRRVRRKFAFQLAHGPVLQADPPGVPKLHHDGEDVSENKMTMGHAFLPFIAETKP